MTNFILCSAEMPATTMFAKFAKSSTNILEHNPISQLFDIGKQTGNGGPGYLWRIHDAVRKSDSRVSTHSIIQLLFELFPIVHVCACLCVFLFRRCITHYYTEQLHVSPDESVMYIYGGVARNVECFIEIPMQFIVELFVL